MSKFQEYKDVYKKEISDNFKEQILVYDIIDGKFSFHPFSHNCENLCKSGCTKDCYKSLGKLMRKNLVFYAYGEAEVLENIENNIFDDLEESINYVYENRLPKRNENQDGLPGEVLLDLILQNIEPDAYKMAVRTIFRQNDNFEIKGYDLTYITSKDEQITLWLGQAKFGDKTYCKTDINKDLISKFESVYMSKQVYFMADKPHGLTDEAKQINLMINRLNRLNKKNKDNPTSDNVRAEAFIEFLINEKININIPCLLAYGENCVYDNVHDLNKKIEKEVESIKKYFEKKEFDFEKINPKIIFYIFPIESLEGMRGKEGFYCGL